MTEDREKMIRDCWRSSRDRYGPLIRERGYVVLSYLGVRPAISYREPHAAISTIGIQRFTFRLEVRDTRDHWRVVCEGVEVEDGSILPHEQRQWAVL